VINADNATLRLKYDFENNSGEIEWVEIVFKEVLAYRYHQSICADIGSNMENNKISEFDISTWLSEVLTKWDQSVGWQKYQIDQGGRSRFKHCIVNFDDVGVFEVICSAHTINDVCP
jgi:hypothetical protein